jgi:hypothetical protein
MYCNCKDKEITFASANITGTGVVAGSTIDLRGTNRMIDRVAVMTHGNAVAPTTLTAALEQSLDGTNWTSVQAITQANNNTVLYVSDKLTQMLRINVSALTLGSATSVTFMYAAS